MLKVKTFPYLSDDDIRRSMSDRNIIRKEIDLDIDSVVSGTDKHSICDLFLLYVSLKPVNLKPFYIKPYLTHKSEIRFAEAEMEKLRQMGILLRGLVNFCPLSCSSKSHIQVQKSIKHPNIAY